MRTTSRYRIGERYWTVSEIAREARLTPAGVWARIRAGVTGDALLKPVQPKAITQAEVRIRQRLREAVRNKYKRTCPNCGCAFDIFQPRTVLRLIKPGQIHVKDKP
jgi:hypothetical protein